MWSKMECIRECIHWCLKRVWRCFITRPLQFIGERFRFVKGFLKIPTLCLRLLCFPVIWIIGILRKIAPQNRDLLDLKEKLKNVENKKEGLKQELLRAELQINDLYEQLRESRQQRDDALTRLSELMSLKLRDGNPNVVDLSDEYRPTKLAEISSELYDNEWTEAYEFLEKNTELDGTSERHHIQFLLDILLEIFDCCTKSSNEGLDILMSEIAANNIVIKKEDMKLLKDLRKKYASGRLQDIEKKCLDRLEVRHQSHISFKNEPILQFVQRCVQLCWLMQFQDPPVVFACPGWKSNFLACPVSMENRSYSTSRDLQPQPGQDNSEQEHQNDPVLVEIVCEKTVAPDNSADSHGTPTASEKSAETLLVSGTRSHGENLTGPAAARSNGQRTLFDRNLFKDFTRKGHFIDFIVWPIMYLHEGGPILSKGVAQGCD